MTRKLASIAVPLILALSRTALAEPSATPPTTPAATVPSTPAAPPAAPPSPAAGDVVILKNGGMLRGTVTELEPLKSVAILVLGSRERRVVPWAEVERVDRGAPPSAPPPPVAPPDPGAPAAPGALPIMRQMPTLTLLSPGLAAPDAHPDRPGLVRLHIDADAPRVELRRVGGAAIARYSVYGNSITPNYITLYTTVCKAPCDAVIDGRDESTFFFGGPGVTDSSNFQLTERRGDVRAHVKTGNASRHSAGYWTMVFGGSAAAGTGLVLALAGSNMGSTQQAVYGGITAAGVVALAAGIYLFATSSTNYELAP